MWSVGAAIFIGIAFAVLIVFAIVNGLVTKRKRDRDKAEEENRQINLADYMETENTLV